MGQRLRLTVTMTCVAMMTVTAGAAERKPPAKTGNSALAFFTAHAHGGVTIDDFLERLRPAPLDEHQRLRVLEALPRQGAIRTGAGDLAKMSLAEDVLAYHGRRGMITFQIIDVAPAFIGLHERTVILVSPPALALVNKEEFAALAAHEIGHEYVWTEYQLAVRGMLIVSGWCCGSLPAAVPPAGAYDATLARVLRLLPRQPDKLVVFDADTSGRALHDRLQHVEGFVTPGERIVYLVRGGETLRRATKGAGIFDYMLATIIWHEMAHIDGADEANARRAEEDLWMQFVLARRVDTARGLNYLILLKKRR
jgi:hypothetical protein